MAYGIRILIKGDYAAFNRPEMKVERITYDVPTPSAIEGLLKSIYWKPALQYCVDKIIVFNPIRFANIRRNEVKETVSLSKIKSQMKNPLVDPGIYTKECINQRAAMVLTNVMYGIEFHFEMTGIRSDEEDTCAKHYNILLRRLRNGQHFRQPCLGCSEFPIRSLELVEDFSQYKVAEELMGTKDLGFMLYGIDFAEDKIDREDWENSVFSDQGTARYYRPAMVDGVIDVARYAKEGTTC